MPRKPPEKDYCFTCRQSIKPGDGKMCGSWNGQHDIEKVPVLYIPTKASPSMGKGKVTRI